MLVEDDEKDIELTLTALAEHDLANDVAVVRDGEEALDLLYRQGKYTQLPEGNPAVVFLDIKMPKVDGLEVLRRMKSDSKLRRVPAVMLTSSREQRDIVESYELGVNAYVVKPVNFEKLMQAVQQLGLFWALINEPPPESPRGG